MLNKELLEKVEKAIEQELQKVLSKPDYTQTDWDGIKKAMCIANMVRGYESGEYVNEEGASYGRSYANHGGYNGYSYMPDPAYGYDASNGYNSSNGRMRSPVTGRYISNGYSGHSIEDRMIMALEQQMDEAKTDYERQLVEKEIQRLRRGDR